LESEEFLAAMNISVKRAASAHVAASSGPRNVRGSEGAEEESQILFVQAMQGVIPVNGKGREAAVPAERGGNTFSHDPAKGLREVVEGKVEFALHHTDE
jgi:hypothetical protein